MSRFGVKIINYILCATLAVGMITVPSVTVYADRSISDVQNSIDHQKDVIEGIEGEIDTLTSEQDILLEQMDDLNAEIINVMTSIGMLEDEIEQKKLDIAETEKEYEVAKQVEDNQREAMKVQVKYAYEAGKTSWLSQLLKSSSFSELLNNITYTESVLAYSNDMLEKYEEAKNKVHELWDQLEAEKADLEKQKVDLEEEKAYCDELLAELKTKVEDYDAMIAKAEKEAKAAKALLQKEQKELKKLKDAERKRLEEERRRQEALNQTYTDTSYTAIIDAASGSDIGKKIAKNACQYIGNPYVYGGTSLTKGTDCSGFTMRIYQEFGYSLPRSSRAQHSVGKEVKYADAQPGDIICYSGHVAIYIGSGYIVHASNSKPYPKGGIKVNKATYRSILSVRRVAE